MKKLLIILNLVLITSKLTAQTPYVAIPDSNFVHYLKTIVPTAFKGDSLNITSTLVTTTTHSINVGGASIANLNGIQYFTSLTYLSCYSNSLTTLPTLPNSLLHLECQVNSISSLPTLPNTLTYLSCGSNPLASNFPSVLPNSLDTLACNGIGLSNLPALPNSLVYLYCSINSLTNLPVLPNSLQTLFCNDNQITCFPTFPNSITSLVISGNPYNCLPNYVAGYNSSNSVPLCLAGNTNGCAVAGIEQYNINNEVKVYPNPTNGVINVSLTHFDKLNAQGTNVTITDVLGNVVKQSIIYNLTSIINVADLSEGIYNLSISTKEGVANKRIVIER